MSDQLPFQIIGKTCGPNPGFIRKLWLIDAGQVQQIPDPVYLAASTSLHVPSRMISFFSGATLHKMMFRNKECLFNESLTRTEAGPKLTQTIQFTLPQSMIETDTWIMDNVNTKWIAFFEDHLRKIRILGSPSIPAELGFGSMISADKSATFSLRCEATHPAYHTDAMPALERVFSSAFGESFS